jgi:two-component system, NtrC family, response regulator HydG
MDEPVRASAELIAMLEQLPGCRILFDTDYRIVAANSMYRSHCARHAGAEVVGRRCYEVSHGYDQPCDQSGESCPRQAALASGRVEQCVHVHHSARGAEHVQVEITPLTNECGEITLFAERMQPLHATRIAGASDELVGGDPSFLRMLDLVARVAPTDTAVLLLGETGTGKEMIARLTHASSRRAHAPFVAVDCSGLTETLFESELFGHEKGSFTGAVVRKAGLVESAAGGTLFLDEVGDIPPALQVKLLRLLETGVYRRVGGTESRHADCRLIAATHRDLTTMVRDERFRSDLYYRISAFPINLPPLRERRSDIALLARSLLRRVRPGQPQSIDRAAIRMLETYDFPGNVRELRNIIERASLLAENGPIETTHLPETVHALAEQGDAASDTAAWRPLRTAQDAALRQAVHEHRGSRRDLAHKLGLSERSLYRKLRALGDSSANGGDPGSR